MMEDGGPKCSLILLPEQYGIPIDYPLVTDAEFNDKRPAGSPVLEVVQELFTYLKDVLTNLNLDV